MNSEHWSKVRLGDCLEEPPDYGANASAVEFSPDLPRYVRITDISEDGELIDTGKKSIPTAAAAGYTLCPGDIVFARTGATVGKTYLHSENGQTCAFAGYLIRFRTNRNRLLPEFLSLYTQSQEYDQWVLTINRSGAQPNINATEYSSLKIPLPEVDEQAKVVEMLSLWQSAIRRTAQLIDAKTRLKRALMQQVLTGVRRFPGFDEPWESHRLGELFHERAESNRPDLPLLSITADRGVIPRQEVERKDTSNEDKRAYLRIAPGDIGYNTMRMWQGVSAVSRLEGVVSPAYTICVPNERIEPDFAGYLFKFPPTVALFHRKSQGMVSDTLNLKFHNFARIKVLVPSRAEQKKIVSVLQTLDTQIQLLQSQLAALKTQKRGLMQLLLSGAVRVQVLG